MTPWAVFIATVGLLSLTILLVTSIRDVLRDRESERIDRQMEQLKRWQCRQVVAGAEDLCREAARDRGDL